MCWSAEADAAAGVLVAGLGTVCLLRVRDPRRLPLAALPLLLGVHQLVEAAVWLGEDGRIGAGPAQAARTVWALIALPLLPLLVPFGVWCAAGPGGTRRRQLGWFAVLGAVVAVPLTAAVLRHPAAAEVRHHTLAYAVGVPWAPVLTAGYLLATIGSLAVSGDRALRRFGLVMGAGAVVCAVLWRAAFASTWCALAALAAVLLTGWSGGTDPPPRPGTAGARPDGAG